MDYTIVGFVCGSMEELIRHTAYLLWQRRQASSAEGTSEDDWRMAKEIVVPSEGSIREAAFAVCHLRTVDGTEGTQEHDWLYAELVLASRRFHAHFGSGS